MDFAWTPELVTGDAEIDRQHREILARAAELVASLERTATFEEIVGALGVLAEYVYVHFDAEERLMVASGFPGLEAHRAAHEALCLAFMALAERFRDGGASPGLAGEVVAFIEGAIAPHVRALDRELAAHLAASAVSRRRAARAGVAPEAERAALEAAARALVGEVHPACLLDATGRVVDTNPAWERFAAGDVPPGAGGGALHGRGYLDCIRGDALVRRLGGVLRRAMAGVAQEVQATCHTAEVARLLTVRYEPVLAATGEAVGLVVTFVARHVMPIADLYPPHARDDEAFLGSRGRLEACAGCGRYRRQDRAGPTWDFVPAYLGPGAPPADYGLCDACFADQFELTRG